MPRILSSALAVMVMCLNLGVRDAIAGDCECFVDFFPDGQITLFDFAEFQNLYFAGDPRADVNCDGKIDEADIAMFKCQFGSSGIPECCDMVVGACCKLIFMGEVLIGTECETCVEGQCDADHTFVPGAVCEATTAEVTEPSGQIVTHDVLSAAGCEEGGNPPMARLGCNPPYRDGWTTPAGATCHNFGVPGSPAIPADFFGPGSDPFTGAVCLEGVPLGDPDLGDADTIIRRADDPFDRCELPGPANRVVDIEIVALNLRSVNPIEVTFVGQPTFWDVFVDLSVIPSPPGQLVAVKEHCNGGIYSSVLNVQPRFTFIEVGNPGNVQVLDTGLEGIPPVVLDPQATPAPWMHDLGTAHDGFDPCTTFHVGVEEDAYLGVVTQCDCNGNNVRDRCDIENGTVEDCNQNRIPDPCDIASGVSQDEDEDGIPDECISVDVDQPVITVLQPMLEPAFPNPLATGTTFAYALPGRGEVRLAIYDVVGRLIVTLIDGTRPAGVHTVDWDGRNALGEQVAAGAYYARLVTAGNVEISKVVVLR